MQRSGGGELFSRDHCQLPPPADPNRSSLHILMTQLEFITELRSVLDRHADSVRNALRRLVTRVPGNARALHLMVFTNQEGDGQFDVFGSIDGPDHYFINKQIADVKDIFSVRHTENGFEPAVPMVDAFDAGFDVNDTVIQCVSEWMRGIWRTTDGLSTTVPVLIVGHDGISTTTSESCN
jgi:hypothetical protein